MATNAEAKILLAYSYGVSVQRIREALQGNLIIRNSRGGPPPSTGEVIGLCGQSGRHPYFRIPLNVLEAALDRIERAAIAANGRSVDSAVEQIAEACRELRQQTYFDYGTGCANDSLPSMVPLLPPEEIWLEDRELPLDIWRLVCFEVDLISSAVSSQVSVEDFAFSAVNQSALAFRFLLNQLGSRRVTFEFKLNNVPAGWGSGVTSPIDVSLARIFFEAGTLLTPLADEDFVKGYAAIRYLHWIDGGSPELRVKDEFNMDTVDCRYRGLFAEETAVGLMAVVLNDAFAARPINNTVEVAPPGSIDRGQPIADFVADATDPTTMQKTTIIAESKGSLGSVVSQARHARAKGQLAATKQIAFPGATQLLPLTFASTIRFSRQRIRSRCVVTDPPAQLGDDAIRIDPAEAWRVAYAKTLKFVGLETAAQQIVRGEPASALRPMDFDRQGDRRRGDRERLRLRRAEAARELFGMSLLLDVGQYALAFDAAALDVLRRRGIDGESHLRLSQILGSRMEHGRRTLRGGSFETSLGLSCISYSELDGGGGRGDARKV